MQLTLMADYYCYPLWRRETDGVRENIDPATLDISVELQQQLAAWDDQYQAIYRPDDPVASAFTSGEAEARFVRQGYQLLQALQRQLPAVEWRYFDVARNCELPAPSSTT